MNNMLTIEEVKNFLQVKQEDLEKLLKQGKLHAYKIGGTYLRFRKEEVLQLRSELAVHQIKAGTPSFFSRIADFWRFNNFYIVSLLILAGAFFFVVMKG